MNYEFGKAHEMLGGPYKLVWSADSLKESYEELISYWDDKVTGVNIESSMTDWPDCGEDDIGWAYATISGNEFAEAIAVVSYWEDSEKKIREFEWGRP